MQTTPFDILHPDQRWRPTPDQSAGKKFDELIPPLVDKIRREVHKWREGGYKRCSDTTRALLNFWFETEHPFGDGEFKFYFSQREAIESIIWLYEVAEARDKFGLMRYDSSGAVSTGMFDETWARYVVKMATGAGKTKVLGLALVWSYFHKLYEVDSPLSQNFLVIAPNIIVLNRLLKDFEGLTMFRNEPFLPENGWADRNWQIDFQPQLHVQDELGPLSPSGNIFLTNIHRVFFNEDAEPTTEEMFLGKKPKADADTNRGLDLGKLLRSERLNDLVVMNDEAHHIHDKSLAWFRDIQDIHNKLKLRLGNGIALQVDSSATPRHNNGSIFVQTICDYPLVEAIKHGVVKTPVLPDKASREKLNEADSTDIIEQFRDHIHLGYQEWEQQYNELNKLRTPILFYMTMNTEEADQLSEYLQQSYPLLKDRVLTIHTKNNGELKGEGNKGAKDKEELERLRKAADSIDDERSPYLAVVSVLVLREGWDVRNVSTIVGLRPYNTDSNVLPEQTLGRGLRKMFALDVKEKLVVVGTRRFLDFVESLKTEGVTFEYKPMGGGSGGKSPVVVEVEKEATDRDISALDIPLPILTPKFYRDYEVLSKLDQDALFPGKLDPRTYTPDEIREIDFEDLDGGLVVDYLGIAADLKKALSFYSDAGGKGDPTIAQEQAVALMLEKLEVVANMYSGFPYEEYFQADTAKKLSMILGAEEHILGLEDGKRRYINEVTALSKSFAIAIPHDQAMDVKDEVGFFQAVKARLVKFDSTGSGRTDEELETTIRQVIDQALVSEKVIDVYDAAGIKKPDISVLSEEFLLELKGMAHKNVAIEVLKKLLNDEIKARARTNIVQSRSLMDMLEDSIKRYHNKILSAAEVIEELIKVSKEITAGDKQAADMGLTEYEYAFYTAVANNDSAKELMQQEKLRELAVVLTERVRQNASIDWTIKESVKAKLKVIVKRTLRHFGYPPDMQKLATELVLRQAEMLAGEFADD